MSRFHVAMIIGSIFASSIVGCGKTALDRSSQADGFGVDGGPTVGDAGTGDAGPGDVSTDQGLPPDDVGTDVGGDMGPDECTTPVPEICGNGIDEDCDGIADDGCRCDFDGTSDGVCQNGVISETDGSCLQPDSYESPETLCDGRDNDCNGQTDENCTCVAGETQPCYNGPAGTETVGECQAGVLECDGGTFGGACVGESTPGDESCNGLDDDCDGVTDEGCACTYRDLNAGVCADAILDEFGNCPAPVDFQEDEVSCDGVDNDCDGVVDEGCPCNVSGLTDGVCSNGVIYEVDGSCVAPSDYEMNENLCDGKDNDCDGQTDENCECTDGETNPCYDGPAATEDVGICEVGQQTCVDGFFGGTCDGQTTPETETCNGLDDDCDGVTDEGCACPYQGNSTGVCSDGLRDESGTCTAPPGFETDESTCDGLDNDCDGVVDEGCSCDYQGTGAGVCSDGTIDSSGTCTPPSTYESDETLCDGLDNDCNGPVDEGCPCDFRDTSVGVCGDAVRNNGGQCKPPTGFTGGEAHCDDGIDNDCDGDIDCADTSCANRPVCQ